MPTAAPRKRMPVVISSRGLETMVLMGMNMPLIAIRAQIASAIDIIIHLGRLRDKSRKILEKMY